MAGAASGVGEERAITVQNLIGQARLTLPAGDLAGEVHPAGAVAWAAPDVIYSDGVGWKPLAGGDAIVDLRGEVDDLAARIIALEVALARTQYEDKVLKFSINQMRIGAAAARNIYGEQISYLMKTTWTEGDVEWVLDATADVPGTPGHVTNVVRWKRSVNDVSFDHELSSLSPTFDVSDGVEVSQGTWTKNNMDGTWTQGGAAETREMIGGGDYVASVSSTSFTSVIDGTIPLNLVYNVNGDILSMFDPPATADPSLKDQTWVNAPAPAGFDGLRVEKLAPEPTSTNVHIDIQTSSESESAFFLRIFGVRASALVHKRPTDEVRRFDHRIIAIDQQVETRVLMAANDYTRDGINVTGASAPLDASQDPLIEVEFGMLILDGEIVDAQAPPAENLFSLWADPKSVVDDAFLAALPSNIIHSGNIVDVVSHGTPARPHAKLSVGNSARSYKRPTSAGRFAYMNYAKLTSLSTGTGFHGKTAPGHAVWYFWKPGTSVWVFGGEARNNDDIADTYQTGAATSHSLVNVHDKWFTEFPSMYPVTPPDPGVPNHQKVTNWLKDIDNAGTLLRKVTPISGYVTLVTGPTAHTDGIIFQMLQGTASNTDDTPYNSSASVGSAHGVSGRVSFLISQIDVPTALVTRDALDFTSFQLGSPFGVVPYLGRFGYGTITNNDYSASGSLKSLFPPMWYLQTQQGYSTELENLTQRVRYLEDYVENFAGVAITAALESLEKVGLSQELISAKIYELDGEIKLNFEQLINYITAAINSLSDLITGTAASAESAIAAEIGGGDSLEVFTALFLQVAPSLLGLIPVVGPAAAKGASIATEIAGEEFKAAAFAEKLGRLLSRGQKLLSRGQSKEGLAYAMFGTLGLNSLLQGIRGPVAGTPPSFDGDGNLVINTELLLAPEEITDPVVLAFLDGRVKPANANDALVETYDAIEDVGALANTNATLLVSIRGAEAAEGYVPAFDPAEPLE